MTMAAPGTNTDKYIACAALVPDCPFEATATTEEELMQMVAEHAAHNHGITEVTPELAEKVRAAIQHRQNA
jgi:predicted small metal-binding protein